MAAAGNFGRTAAGDQVYGGITAPGNAPWVLTVGAYDAHGTAATSDDEMAPFSSKGPTAVDYRAKPDVVAPGIRVTSLAAAGSTLVVNYPNSVVSGVGPRGTGAYLTLSGTSMAAPAVTGVVALMLQANPTLTPNAVKALIQYTAIEEPGVTLLAQGAGEVNADGAVRLARFFLTAEAGDPLSERSVLEPQPDLGQLPRDRRRAASRRDGLGQQHRVGLEHRLGLQHRVGLEHRLGQFLRG